MYRENVCRERCKACVHAKRGCIERADSHSWGGAKRHEGKGDEAPRQYFCLFSDGCSGMDLRCFDQ